MTSRRWSGLPANGLPGIVRPATAVLALAAFLSLTMLAGRAGAAHHVVVASPRVVHVVDARALPHVVAPLPDVTSALGALDALDPVGRGPAATANRSHSRASLHRWVRPYGGVFSSPFGYRWGRLHAGVDLAGPWGSTIVAATGGCIEYAGPQDGYGEVMRIRDWDGTETVYGHMSSFIRRSGCVTAGDPIARVGAGGDATGPHLHFEVHVGGVPINPVPFLAARGVFL